VECEKLKYEVELLRGDLNAKEEALKSAVSQGSATRSDVSEMMGSVQHEVEQELRKLRTEAGDIEARRRQHLLEEEVQETKVRNQLLVKELGDLRQKIRIASLEKDAFKQDAEMSSREVDRHRIERQELLVTIQRLQDEVAHQSQRVDEAFLKRAAGDILAGPPATGPLSDPPVALSAGTAQTFTNLSDFVDTHNDDNTQDRIATAIIEKDWNTVKQYIDALTAAGRPEGHWLQSAYGHLVAS